MNSRIKQIILLMLTLAGAFFVNFERLYIGFPDSFKSDKDVVQEKIYYAITVILLLVSIFLIIKIFKNKQK